MSQVTLPLFLQQPVEWVNTLQVHMHFLTLPFGDLLTVLEGDSSNEERSVQLPTLTPDSVTPKIPLYSSRDTMTLYCSIGWSISNTSYLQIKDNHT